MRAERCELEGLMVLEPKCFADHRGYFFESYSARTMEELGINLRFVQDNESYSAHCGTIRGIHLQKEPEAQSKLVRCCRGGIMDYAVDLRRNSPTYLKWMAVELTSENRKQLLIPKGFGHAFLTLEDHTVVQYKVDAFYDSALDCTIRWDDPQIGIDWGIGLAPILSDKDKNAPLLYDCNLTDNEVG